MRVEARIKCSIWTDSDFLALDSDAKLAYFSILSQPTLTLCGVIGHTPRGWAHDTGLPLGKMKAALRALADARFIVVDEDTDELLVRTLARNDGILEQPNLVVAMSKDFRGIRSNAIRRAFIDSLPPTFMSGLEARFPEAFRRGLVARLTEEFRQAFGEGLGEPLGEGFPEGLGEGLDEPLLEGLTEAFGEPLGEGSRVRVRPRTRERLRAYPYPLTPNPIPQTPSVSASNAVGVVAAESRATDDPVKSSAHQLAKLAFEQPVKPTLRHGGSGAFVATMALIEDALRAGMSVQEIRGAITAGGVVWTKAGLATAIAKSKPRRSRDSGAEANLAELEEMLHEGA